MLLIHGARTALPRFARKSTPLGRLSAAFSASSRSFGVLESNSSLKRKMSSAIIVAPRYAIPLRDQYGPGFRYTQQPSLIAPSVELVFEK